MKKHFSICIVLSVLGLLCSLSACHSEEEAGTGARDDGGKPPIDRTVLVYMVAENSLGAYGFHRGDSAEIMAGRGVIADDDRMLILMDAGGRPTLYRVRADRDRPEVVKQWAYDFCSADPDRLREVLETVRELYPSREYALTLWSHADGWMAPTDSAYRRYESPNTASAMLRASRQALSPLSFGIDSGANGRGSNDGAQMSVEGLARAIAGAGMHMKYLFFDACLMQNLETAYALRHVTDYVAGSPMAVAGAGAYYVHQLREGLFAGDPSAICRTYLADVSSDALYDEYQDCGAVTSCLRTDKLEALASALRDAMPHSALAERHSPALDTVLNYQAYTHAYYYRPHNYDALQALRHILPAAYLSPVVEALDDVVVYRGATPRFWIGPSYFAYQTVPVESGDYSGVSIFVPQNVYTTFAGSTPHGDLNQAWRKTEWYRDIGAAATGW